MKNAETKLDREDIDLYIDLLQDLRQDPEKFNKTFSQFKKNIIGFEDIFMSRIYDRSKRERENIYLENKAFFEANNIDTNEIEIALLDFRNLEKYPEKINEERAKAIDQHIHSLILSGNEGFSNLKDTFLWLKNYYHYDIDPVFSEHSIRGRLLILWLLQKHDYINDIGKDQNDKTESRPFKSKLLQNEKKNITLISKLLNIPEASIPNILSDLGEIFNKKTDEANKAYISHINQFLPLLKKLAELIENDLFPDINYDIKSKIDDFEKVKSSCTAEKKLLNSNKRKK